MSLSSSIKPLGVPKELHVVCACGLSIFFFYFFLHCMSQSQVVAAWTANVGYTVYVIFLRCVILNPVISSCLVFCCFFFYCLYACIIDLLTARCLLSMFLDKQLLTLWLWTVTISFLRFSSWLTSRSTTWWRWHVISLFCFTRSDLVVKSI